MRPRSTRPDRVEYRRESLNVESGLNDGICVPVILFFIALTAGTMEAAESVSLVVELILKVIGIGMAVGLGLAVIGGFALRTCAARDWIAGTWIKIPVIALALLCFGLAQWLGGSGFIAAFVGGLTFGALNKQHKEQFLETAEGTSDVVAMVIDQQLPGNETIVAVVSWTIVLSIVLHGLSANWLASRYGARVDARGGEI